MGKTIDAMTNRAAALQAARRKEADKALNAEYSRRVRAEQKQREIERENAEWAAGG